MRSPGLLIIVVISFSDTVLHVCAIGTFIPTSSRPLINNPQEKILIDIFSDSKTLMLTVIYVNKEVIEKLWSEFLFWFYLLTNYDT